MEGITEKEIKEIAGILDIELSSSQIDFIREYWNSKRIVFASIRGYGTASVRKVIEKIQEEYGN